MQGSGTVQRPGVSFDHLRTGEERNTAVLTHNFIHRLDSTIAASKASILVFYQSKLPAQNNLRCNVKGIIIQSKIQRFIIHPVNPLHSSLISTVTARKSARFLLLFRL